MDRNRKIQVWTGLESFERVIALYIVLFTKLFQWELVKGDVSFFPTELLWMRRKSQSYTVKVHMWLSYVLPMQSWIINQLDLILGELLQRTELT